MYQNVDKKNIDFKLKLTIKFVKNKNNSQSFFICNYFSDDRLIGLV